LKNFDADAVEMEGAAFAQTAQVNGIPFLIIRTLSDLADEKAEVDFEKFKSKVAINSFKVIREILKSLK